MKRAKQFAYDEAVSKNKIIFWSAYTAAEVLEEEESKSMESSIASAAAFKLLDQPSSVES
jgi:hypothetical protein